MQDNKSSQKASPAKREIKNYSLDLPMFDLGEVVKVITEIHEKALETAKMAAVAHGCGFKGSSSTPFYRRIVAARLFKLLSAQGAALTPQALDYLKPDREDAKSEALKNSILAIPAYGELIETHQGKRLNPEIIANGFVRRFNISQAAAAICAKSFIGSLKFAEFLEADGSLVRFEDIPKEKPEELSVTESGGKAANAGGGGAEGKKTQERSYSLVLDANRSIMVTAPLSIKQSELKRLQDWLALQLLVVPDGPSTAEEIN